MREIAAHWRLAAHLGAGALFAGGALVEHGLAAGALAALCIAWMANLYNFMDGSDGLAGGMALIGFSFYGVAAAAAGSTPFALLNFSIAAAAAAFLVFNFHPARIFMGDAGSVPLGFLAAALGILGWLRNDWTWWFPLLVFSPFIIDASVTLARRHLRAGEGLAGAPRPLLPAPGAARLGAPQDRARRVRADARLRRDWARGARGAGAVQALLLGAACAAYLALIAAVGRAWRRRQPVAAERRAAP